MQLRDYGRHWTSVHLDFVVQGIDKAFARAVAAGATVERPTQTSSWGKLALLIDPFGNGLCLVEFVGRGYDEIAGVLRAARESRGARGPNGPTEAVRKCQQAFQSGSEEAIVAVFDQHPELAEMCPADGRTMLHQAAGLGALRWMKWLLDRGADVNRSSREGWTPLDYAATGRGGDWVFDNQKFEGAAALLLEHGCAVKAFRRRICTRPIAHCSIRTSIQLTRRN
jgi:hypothetical protein